MPEGWSFAQGAAFLVQSLTAYYGLKSLGNIKVRYAALQLSSLLCRFCCIWQAYCSAAPFQAAADACSAVHTEAESFACVNAWCNDKTRMVLSNKAKVMLWANNAVFSHPVCPTLVSMYTNDSCTCTAMLVLMQGGSCVLVHSAAGGVGLNALAICLALGAVPIGTVSSPDKVSRTCGLRLPAFDMYAMMHSVLRCCKSTAASHCKR